MKAPELARDCGRPIAFYPKLCKCLGSINAGLFACQLLYWEGKQADPDGWIYKTAGEMEEETGLTRREQETARKILKKKGVLQEKLKGVPATMHYKLNLDRWNELYEAYPSFNKSANPVSTNETIQFGAKRQSNTESTSTFGTTEKPGRNTNQRETGASGAPPAGDPALWIQNGSWNGDVFAFKEELLSFLEETYSEVREKEITQTLEFVMEEQRRYYSDKYPQTLAEHQIYDQLKKYLMYRWLEPDQQIFLYDRQSMTLCEHFDVEESRPGNKTAMRKQAASMRRFFKTQNQSWIDLSSYSKWFYKVVVQVRGGTGSLDLILAKQNILDYLRCREETN